MISFEVFADESPGAALKVLHNPCTSLITFSRQLGASLGVALLGALLNAQWAAGIQRDLTAAGGADAPTAEQLLRAHGADGSPANSLVIDAFVDSFQATMLVATGVTALLIASCATLLHHALPRRAAPARP